MKTALVQLNSSDDPAENLLVTTEFVADAAAMGAQFVLTPEVTNCVSTSRAHQNRVLQHEADDATLAMLRRQAAELKIWLLIGSLAVKTSDPDGRFANRSFLIGPDGAVVARYDKIHMFDVQVTADETYQESAGYRPGTRAVIGNAAFGTVGMTICYDVRFAHLFRALAMAGAEILTVPAAFSPVTGDAHWLPLLRARAIETGCWVLAPAQCGHHRATDGRSRHTHGNSVAIAPWGEVVVHAGDVAGVHIFDLDVTQAKAARRRIPSLNNARDFSGP
jgi:predicted amidohydrolase